jgi:hypothetical protein
MKLTAKLIKILTLQTGTSPNGNWIKQDIVVETKENYPKKVVLTNWNNQFDITSLKVGSYYDFELLLESKAYNGGYYSSAVIIEQPSTTQDISLSQAPGFTLFKHKMLISAILPETTGTGWTKRGLIFDPIEQGYKSLTAYVLNNKAELTSFSEGDEVNLAFYIEGREYNQKWYNDFKIWKIELIKKGNIGVNHQYNVDDPDSWPF